MNKNIIVRWTFREIRSSAARFISIFGIVLVGVAFFTGIKSAAPYMKNSADAYYDSSNFYDLRVFSESGITNKDIKEISEIKGVESVNGAYIINALSEIDTSEHVIQMMSFLDNSFNKLDVTKGRLPRKADECVLRDYEMHKTTLSIGDKITVYEDDGALNCHTYTITGFVSTPYYLSYQYDTADKGSGNIDTIMFVNDAAFNIPYYQTAYVNVDGAKEKDTYSDNYFKITDPVKSKITGLGYTVLDRKQHFTYVDYENCANRMDAIAKVFPIFFYLVAALVCLTTMTRMVDEQRENIGTMKALGYNRLQIAFKYIVYSIFASLGGGICGCFAGLAVFPKLIFNAWGIVYTVDKMVPVIQYKLCFGAVITAVLVNVLATLVACMSTFLEEPTMLLRPKAPKKGKKVFLENIKVIWKRISFSGKVTARNIIRYKKRFFMTTIGIAGCTALILAGFGIKNSVSTIVDRQYTDIYGYDVDITLHKETQEDEKASLFDGLLSDSRTKDAYIYSKYQLNAYNNTDMDKSKEISLISVDNNAKYMKFTKLYDEAYKHTVDIPDSGALISHKLAKDFNLSVGDKIYVKYNNETYAIEIKNIISMYVGQYIFISDSYFKEVFNGLPDKRQIAAYLNISGEKSQQEYGKEIMNDKSVESITYYSGLTDKFNKIISSLDIITIVLIVSAAILAFIVLYNLINVNISERIREIATIKVLGFYDSEVQNYVYRENIILTVIGSFIGLFLGILLHSYIMNVIEMDDVIFPKVIFWYSYVYAFGITVIFGFAVNMFMNIKLRKIKMVESLKSVE